MDNRELSLLIWLIIFFASIFIKKKVRESFYRVLKIYFSFNLIKYVLFVLLYTIAVTLWFWIFKIWNISILKGTIYWFLFVAIPLLFKSPQAEKEDKYFRRIIFSNIKLTIILEYVVNLYVFNIFIELTRVPLIAFLALTSVIIEKDNKNKNVKRALDTFLVILGLILSLYSIYYAILDRNQLMSLNTIRNIGYPLILTICYIPCLYVLTINMMHEEFKTRLKFKYGKNNKIIDMILNTISARTFCKGSSR